MYILDSVVPLHALRGLLVDKDVSIAVANGSKPEVTGTRGEFLVLFGRLDVAQRIEGLPVNPLNGTGVVSGRG